MELELGIIIIGRALKKIHKIDTRKCGLRHWMIEINPN